VNAEQFAEQARANEAELRHQAETREKITQATFLISQGKFNEADKIATGISFREPTLDGAAVLRALGDWHARNGRWTSAADRFLQVLQVDQLDAVETVAQDFLSAGAALASAGEMRRFENFRQGLLTRSSGEKNPVLAQSALCASLSLPATTNVTGSLLPLARIIAPPGVASVGNVRAVEERLDARLKLQNVGTTQPSSFDNHDGLITLVGGGGDIYENNDQFAYAYTAVQGDFDCRMRVHSVRPALDQFTRAGLMARESLNSAGTRHMMVAVNANGTFQVIVRSAENAFSESLPQNPLPEIYGTNSWVRLQRVGAIFHAYTSSNGVDWAELYSASGRHKPFNDLVYLGIAVCAHSTNAVATNVVSDLSTTPTVPPGVALTLALWELRTGHYETSAAWCRRLLAYPDVNPVQNATAQVILALANKRLGRVHEAQPMIEAARQSIEKKISDGLETGSKADGFWFDWMLARELLTEAGTPDK
jgi:hypothetical protein